MNFKDRIATHYLIATASIMLIIFGMIYLIVWLTVENHINQDLQFEARKHITEVELVHDSLQFFNKGEWKEREHQEVQVHPVFVQLIDTKGRIMDKSPNLKGGKLRFVEESKEEMNSSELNGQNIRQVQLPIFIDSKLQGYILTAMNSESYDQVLGNLGKTLLISYFLILFGLYYISRWLAGRSILPVSKVTSTISRISRDNLAARVPLPANQDELYELSRSFNSLLERIEEAMRREKQFTSDASHELRTPLASLRGTLEVLIRRGRSQEEYEEKVKLALKEIDRLSILIEQLLQLARLDEKTTLQNSPHVAIKELVHQSIHRFEREIKEMAIKVTVDLDQKCDLKISSLPGSLIMDNLLSNAIKYSPINSKIIIKLHLNNQKWELSIIDQGMGIAEEDQKKVFESFFRSKAPENKKIKGSGLGLSIVKKCLISIDAELKVDSRTGKGTEMILVF